MVPPGLLARLGLLMVLCALSEGVGLFLLIPVIGTVGGGAMPSVVTEVLGSLGIPLDLAVLLGLFVAVIVARSAIAYSRTLLSLRLGIAVVDGTRARMFSALVRADWRRLSQMRQSDNTGLLVGTIDRLSFAVDQALAAIAAAIMLAGAFLTALALSPRVALVALAGGALVVVAYRGIRSRAVRLGELLGDTYRQVHARMDESLGALRLIKSHSAESRAEHDFAASFAAMRAAEVDFTRTVARGQAALQVAGAMVLALATWLAIGHWQVAPAVLLPLVALIARAVPLLGALQQGWQNWLHAVPAIIEAEAVRRDLVAHAELAPASNLPPPALRHEIALDRVTLHHPGRSVPALDAISLVLPAGSATALVGPSGAGKSTLADILGGLVAPDEGAMSIDGQLLEGAVRQAWRGAVAYVQQEPVLFHASIRDNLRWAEPGASEADLVDALEAASARFVFDLPGGLDTVIGDSGRQLSGGERQRLALARGLLRHPALLILDEPTSSLDAANEDEVVAALGRLRGTVTMLVIAHRGLVADLADRIVRLDRGRIAEMIVRQGAAA